MPSPVPLTSLTLRLGQACDVARLTCDPAWVDDFIRLTGRYTSCMRLGPSIAEIDLEDFLANLGYMRDWDHEPVEWDAALSHLVRTNITDEAELQRQLEGPPALPIAWAPGQDWTAALTDFQLRDIGRLLSLSHGANFSVPGAGKTRVALAVYHSRKLLGQVRRLLIVAPKSAYGAWKDENLECFAARPLEMREIKDHVGAGEALILNYERLPQLANDLARWLRQEPTMMIVDEGHRMKRGNAGVHGRTVLSLAPLARHRLILTGTPAPNGVVDLQNVMSFPWPGSGRRQVQRATNSGDLRAASRLLKPLFTRTTKSELGLPPFEPKVAYVDLPPLHRQVYKALLGHFAADAPDLAQLGRIVMYLLMAADCPSLIPMGTTPYEPLSYMVPPLGAVSDPALQTLMRDLPSFEVSPKYLAATNIATRNAELGRKTIIWSTFVRSLTSLNVLMDPLDPAMVHGGTEDREEQIRRFLRDPDCWVLLTNPATLGEGINLHRTTNDAVYVDRDFAAGRYLQSLDRIHRLGLPRDAQVNVTVLVASQTIDQIVELRLAHKLRFMGAVLDDPDVEELADLDEDPTVASGLGSDDVLQVLSHLSGHAS
jgi:SNF2 family DNA or RNA helicase